MKKTVTLMALVFSACAPQVQQIKSYDGTTNQLIRCDDMAKCILKAKEVCKGKYEVIDQSTTNDTVVGVRLIVKCDADKVPTTADTNVFMPSPTLPMPYSK